MKYKEYKGLDLVKAGEEILQYWKKNSIFEQSVQQREGKTAFNFYEGPPSANGTPGIHHVMARTIKDIFCRYKSLQGYCVKRKGGWDTHGLPVELQVEKELGIDKSKIGKGAGKKISVEDYNQHCREAVLRYKSAWEELTEKMGFWIDMDDPYITFDKKYVESVWHLLKRLYDKNLLYKGYTIQPYSPMAGTGLSSHELNQTGCYRQVKDTSIVAQFKVANTQNDYFLAWTTTPWTLPSNVALAVGKHINYVKVKTFNPYTHQLIHVILAKDLLGKYFSEKQAQTNFESYQPGDNLIPFQVVEEYKGENLVGMCYEQLLNYVKPQGKAFYVIAGDFVSTEEGTGIVHAAPTFGADDLSVCRKAGILGLTVKDENGKDMPLVDKRGRFVKEVSDFGGRYIKAEYESAETLNNPQYKPTDVLIAIKLKKENKAFKVEKYEHSYPHCWRTDKPILYYPLDSWFIRTTACKDRLVELNKTIHWKPTAAGIGRFGNWLENLVDWNLSRSRFWGTPLPIWRTEDGKEEKCIGSLKELSKEIDKAIKVGVMPANYAHFKDGVLLESFDLHRPFVDEIVLVSHSGQPMYREPDLIDVWFDSGAMPFAQWHYPFENKSEFANNFPADYIAEGVDQTRGWFFTLHAIAVMLEDSVAFKHVISNGLVLDKHGNKMSKRLGNAIDPFKTIQTHGIDAVRWYMMENASPWENLKFDLSGVEEVKRKFFGTLYNTYAFFALYANLDNFAYEQAVIPLSERIESDCWIISRLNTLILNVTSAYNNYEPSKASRAIQEFTIDDLSNWYVRLNRKRFWEKSYDKDKIAAYQTLYDCLVAIAQLMASIAPFYADKLYRDLNRITKKLQADSVHLTNFPKANTAAIDKDLEAKMKLSQTIASLVHSLRKKEKIKVRQPLSRILVATTDTQVVHQIKSVSAIILSEVNVKTIEFLKRENEGMFVKTMRPNFGTLGKKYGKLMKNIAQIISAVGQQDINNFEQTGKFTLKIGKQLITLTLDEVAITYDDIPGWSIAKGNGLTVALDITLADDLRQEGIARDIINKIQNMRKNIKLGVQDKIHIRIQRGNAFLQETLAQYETYICDKTQALSLSVVEDLPHPVSLVIDDQKILLSIKA